MIVLNESTKGFIGKGRGWTVRILMKNTQIVKIRPRRVIMKAPGAVRNGCGIRLGMEGAGNNNTSGNQPSLHFHTAGESPPQASQLAPVSVLGS
jgi:hypothetical protein